MIKFAEPYRYSTNWRELAGITTILGLIDERRHFAGIDVRRLSAGRRPLTIFSPV
jgi:hypothetical protein